MIETKKINDDPVIIQHKVYSFTNPQETINDIKVAIDVINKSVINENSFNLLLDFSEPKDESNYNLAAHKEWATGFKEKIVNNKNVQKVAVLGKNSPKFNAEKEYMEDDNHRWFTDYDEAIGWLKISISRNI
jgi:hypothetical protein